jgi:hypothetical protein
LQALQLRPLPARGGAKVAALKVRTVPSTAVQSIPDPDVRSRPLACSMRNIA